MACTKFQTYIPNGNSVKFVKNKQTFVSKPTYNYEESSYHTEDSIQITAIRSAEIAREDFIAFIPRESFKSYISKLLV
jgi:hypothetical protein